MPIPQKDMRLTYSDYLNWDGDERWELIDGFAYAMSPAPTPVHQEISVNLSFQISAFLRGKPYKPCKPCKLFTAPFDVRLNADGDDNTVLQPDLVVVCDPSKIDDKGCIGTPDLIIEIISPSTARRDRIVKLQQYRQILYRGVCRNGRCAHKRIASCSIDLADVFAT